MIVIPRSLPGTRTNMNTEIIAAREDKERSKSIAPSFLHPALAAGLVGAAALAVWKLSDVLVLAFSAALLALLLRGLAHEVSRRTRIPESWAVLPVALLLLGSIAAIGWLFGSQITSQFNLLAKDLPQSLAQLAHGGSSARGRHARRSEYPLHRGAARRTACLAIRLRAYEES